MATEVGLPALERLAYSQEPATATVVVPSVARYGWGWVFDRAALLLLLATLLAAGIVVVGYTPTASQQQLQAAAPAAAAVTGPADTTTPPEPLVVPADAQHRLAGDDWYLSMVNAGLERVDMSVSNPAGSVNDGHRVCGYIAAGHTVTQTIDEVVAGLPDTLTPAHARTIATAVVSAAVKAYCP